MFVDAGVTDDPGNTRELRVQRLFLAVGYILNDAPLAFAGGVFHRRNKNPRHVRRRG